MVRSCRRRAAGWGGGRALGWVCCQLLQLMLGLKETAKATDTGMWVTASSFFWQEQQPNSAGQGLFREPSGHRFCAF